MTTLFVDARCFQDPNYAYRGIGRHASHLLRTVRDRGGSEINLIAVAAPALPAMSEEHRALFGQVIAKAPLRFSPGDGFFQPSPMTHDPAFIERFLVRKDLFKTAIIHDFIPYDAAGYLTDAESLARYEVQLANLSRLDAFFPNSRYSGRRLAELRGVDETKIHVTGIAVGDAFYTARTSAGAGGVDLSPHGYYFFVGGGDRRKNAPLAIQATAECNRAIGRDLPLVICGNYEAGTIAELSALRPGHKLVFLSDLPDARLAALYRDSLLTVAPSFIEGFSIPVVEAVAAGSPVFLSNCDAHLELIDTADTLFPPDDATLAAAKMAAFALRPELRGDLVRRQSEGMDRYRGDQVGERFWGGFISAWRRHGTAAESGRRVTIQSGDKRPRIAFLTPWPPERSGVADYSMVTCRALSALCRLDVFTRAVPTKATELPEGRIFDLDSPELDERNYDRIVHVIGNSHFHKPILDRLVSHGGAAVIHDARLLDYYYYHLSPPDMADLTARVVGRPVTRAEIDSWINRPSRMESMFLDDVLESADPVLVHHRGFAEEIGKRYGVPVRYVPFAMTKDIDVGVFADTRKVQARSRIGARPDSILVAAFGLVAKTRGDGECLYAVKHLVNWGYPVDFRFVGQVDPIDRARLEELADSLGIRANISFADGYISDDLYISFLLAADYAVQLRKVGMGQGSGTVVDCAGVGLTCVANRNLADSVEAPSFVQRIPDVISPLLIAEKIADGIEAGAHKTRHADEREAYRRTHSPEVYAEHFIKAIAP